MGLVLLFDWRSVQHQKCAASKCTTSPLRHKLCDDLIRVGVCVREAVYRRWPSPIPIASAFCRTAVSVRFRAFATWATGVFALECALSSRTSSLVQGLRAGVFFFGISFRPILAGRCNIVAHQAQPNARILRVRSGCHLHRERHRHCSLRLRPAGAVIGRNCPTNSGSR